MIELDEVKAVRRALGGSLNDVVLTIVTGAVRRFLEQRRVPARRHRLPRDGAGQRARRDGARPARQPRLGLDRAAAARASPTRRCASRRSAACTEELKQKRQAVGGEVLTQAADWTPATLLSLAARNVTRSCPSTWS